MADTQGRSERVSVSVESHASSGVSEAGPGCDAVGESVVTQPEQPCAHGGRHPHGHRNRYVIDKCRCRPCRDAAHEYEVRRRRDRLYGRECYVNAEPVRQHVRELQAAGMGWKRIARKAGISCSVMWKLLYGCPQRNMGPSKRVTPKTADAILAVELDVAGGAYVPAGPTWMRIHGLIAHGYSKAWIARQLGSNTPALQLSGTAVKKAHADAVQLLAEQYALIPGPSLRARRYAAERGWTTDLLWIEPDDWSDSLDVDDEPDEIAIERAMRGEAVALTATERLEAARRLLALGINKTEIGRRLRLSSQTTDTLLAQLSEVAA